MQKRDRNMNGAEFRNIYITYEDGLNASLRSQNVRLVSSGDLCDSRVTAGLSISCSSTTIHSSETKLTSPKQLTTDVTTKSHAIPLFSHGETVFPTKYGWHVGLKTVKRVTGKGKCGTEPLDDNFFSSWNAFNATCNEQWILYWWIY